MSHGGSYTIYLKSLPQGSSSEDFTLDDSFFASRPTFDIPHGQVLCRVEVDRVGEVFYITFSLQGTIETHCDRCLSTLTMQIDAQQQIVVKQGAAYEELSDEEIVVPHENPSLDCADLLFEYVVLSLPISRTHPDGECSEVMQSLLQEHTPDHQRDARWAQLQGLRDALQNKGNEG